MPLKHREQSLREIGARLEVAAVLEGSIRRDGDRVRIVAQLIDAETDHHLWAETYDRQLTDIFVIQTDVAWRIAAALETELSPDERTRLRKEPTRDLQAYKLYLQGRNCSFRYTQEGIRKGIEYFQHAIVKEPAYSLAYVGLALAYAELGLGHAAGALKPREAYQQARKAVAKALELDEGLGEAHGMLAFLRVACDFDWTGAEREFKRAFELNPGNADIYALYGHMLSALERYDEAVDALTRAQQLDPLAHRSDLAATLLRAGRHDEAVRAAALVIELDPHYSMGHATLGWVYLKKGMYTKGLAELERAISLAPGNTTMLTMPFMVKNAAFRRDRSSGRTTRCSHTINAAPSATAPKYGHPRPSPTPNATSATTATPCIAFATNRLRARPNRTTAECSRSALSNCSSCSAHNTSKPPTQNVTAAASAHRRQPGSLHRPATAS